MQRAREEKRRKDAMFERGEPQIKQQPSTYQLIEQDTQELGEPTSAGLPPNQKSNFQSRRSDDREREPKYRTRGQLVVEEMNNPHDPNEDEVYGDEDIGPTSLTINTRQFDENHNDQDEYQMNLENQNSETQQFALDEQAADDTSKQYNNRRSKASRKESP